MTNLFKLHGTLANDRSTGHSSSLIITGEDYDRSSEYRELVYDRLLHETSRNDVVIIGHSLADPDLNLVLNEAIRRKRESGASGRLYTLVYTPDENRATLVERRGFQVCFGGLDDFFAELNKTGPNKILVHSEIGDILDSAPHLRPVTIDASHSLQHEVANVLQLFNGSAASYGDIKAGLTFPRDVSISIETHLSGDDKPVAYLLGPAGLGKTTAARQIMTGLSRRGALCWEHKVDYHLDGAYWNIVAAACQAKGLKGVLFVDNAHTSLRQIDVIVDHLASTTNSHFKLLLTSTPGRWHPRSKTPYLFKVGKEYNIDRLSNSEINSLIDMFYNKREIAVLVEGAFSGFSRQEKFRRLAERCRADMFVCMKNIFGFDSLDDIILRDYSQMENELQDVYRAVAAMEASNIRVHRQLVMRILGIRADFIEGLLRRLIGIVTEYDIDAANGIYGWRGRHPVISDIILKYKYNGQEQLFDLYKMVAENVNPTYDIEQMTINEICDYESGIGRINDKSKQNYLYRKLISLAPGQRVPRHRLIYNLIEGGDYDSAANEIRLFEKELRSDAPLMRFRAMLPMHRATSVIGLMTDDRIVILNEAMTLAESGIRRYPSDKALYRVSCDIGLEIMKLSGKWDSFDKALGRLIEAEKEYLDPEMGRLIARIKTKAENLAKAGIGDTF